MTAVQDSGALLAVKLADTASSRNLRMSPVMGTLQRHRVAIYALWHGHSSACRPDMVAKEGYQHCMVHDMQAWLMAHGNHQRGFMGTHTLGPAKLTLAAR